MLMGEYNHNLDAKGRLIIPAKLRYELGDSFVVTKGFDGCLYCYGEKEWKNIEEKFRTMPQFNKDARKITRFFFAGAAAVELDSQGRFLIPQSLREYAGIDREVVIVGVLDRAEIWDKKRFTDKNTYSDDEMDEVAEKLSDLGLNL